ncbi:DUF885 domain-containing protein [Oceanirhabdus sp. W0125-5]|uniref:DUF885 domain-containing protein n=1 Tax=Oceanirhabdus sp. W0125-5 TaxID=2999116 RepID=UPI0022F342F1|nr:DUF885 domain-containing protein [Oceanirhabdus sp. W0125-5]WBW95723.1 DUF885 domain-containing protein [Oceanirhabdus sp. W0125-5]
MKKILVFLIIMIIFISGCSTTEKDSKKNELNGEKSSILTEEKSTILNEEKSNYDFYMSKAKNFQEFQDLMFKDIISIYPSWDCIFTELDDLGLDDIKGRLNTGSEEEINKEKQLYIEALEKLNSFKDIDKSDINFLTVKWYLNLQLEGLEFKKHLNPFWGINGIISSTHRFFSNDSIIEDEVSAVNFINRFKLADDLILNTLKSFEEGNKKGIYFNNYVMYTAKGTITNCYELRNGRRNDVYKYFEEKIKPLNIENKDELLAQLITIIDEEYIPALTEVSNKLIDFKSPRSDVIGAADLPDGKEYYQFRIKQQTTTNLTPEEIMKLGESEVKRIRDEIKKSFEALGYDSSDLISAYNKLAMNDKIYNGQLAVAQYQKVMKNAMDNLNKIVPKEFIPESLPDIKPSGGGNYYSSPSFDLSRAGTFYIDLGYNHVDYAINTLAFHETIPGHHLEREKTIRNPNISEFLKMGHYGAYVEGWALYAEKLADEMQFSNNPKHHLGYLKSELFRATRLVVDTGLNYFGWDLNKAGNYMVYEGLQHPSFARSEIIRYTAIPAQACSYKLGELSILKLREKAKKELGEKFDLVEFNGWILENGSIPLDVLSIHIDNRIKEKK